MKDVSKGGSVESFFFICDDFGGRFDKSLPACVFVLFCLFVVVVIVVVVFFGGLVLSVEISARALYLLFRPG